MPLFIGTYEDFNRYIVGFCRNKARQITMRRKRRRRGICEHCGKKASLQSAHRRGFEQSKIIKELFYRNYDQGIDLDAFRDEYVKAHQPIESHIVFLCQKCHKKYDSELLSPSTQNHAEIHSDDQAPLNKKAAIA
jgi:transposase-like protein